MWIFRIKRFSSALARVCLSATVLLAFGSGCASLSKRKVDDSVVPARQLTLRGVDEMQHGRFEQAERLFAESLELCPLDEGTRRYYADMLWRRGSRLEAIRHMEEAVRLSGGNAEYLVQLGDMYLASGDFERAGLQAELAIQANRDLASAWALRGDVLRQKGQPVECLASYHRALSQQPHYPRVQTAIAETYYAQGRDRRALSTLVSLADGYPPNEVPVNVLAMQGAALKRMGRYDAAVATLTKAQQAGEPTIDLLYQLAEAQFLAGDPGNAMLTLKNVLSRAPRHAPSRQLEARLATANRRLAAAP